MSLQTRPWVVPVVAGVGGGVGGLFAAWLALGEPVVAQETVGPSPAVASAQEFRLVDQRGRLRAVLGFSAEDEPYLALRHRNDTTAIWLGLSEESGLAIHDVDGKTRLVLSVDTAGKPSLVLRDRQRQTRSITP